MLAPESLGIPSDVHDRVYEKEKKAHHEKKPVNFTSIPEMLELLKAPGLVAACNQLVGENWAIVPFTHNASFVSGPKDQHWHKDDNSPRPSSRLLTRLSPTSSSRGSFRTPTQKPSEVLEFFTAHVRNPTPGRPTLGQSVSSYFGVKTGRFDLMGSSR